MSAFKIILFLLLAIIVAIFAVKNMDLVEVSFYDFRLNSHNIHVPLLIVVLVSLGVGFLVAWFGGLINQWKLKAIIRKKDKTIQSLNSELEKLKVPSLPERTGENDS